MVSSIKLELCSIDTNLIEKVLACEYLSIYDISNYLKDDLKYLPTYGPRFIDLYNETDKSKFKKQLNRSDSSPDAFLNLTVDNDKIHYVARLFLSIDSNKEFKESDKNLNESHKLEPMLSNEFIAFVILDEVYMIDPRFKDGQLSFQLCIGKHGYEASSCSKSHTNMTEPQKPVQLGSIMPVYLPYEKAKKCLTLKFKFEDMRDSIYKYNFIQNSLKKFVIYFFCKF